MLYTGVPARGWQAKARAVAPAVALAGGACVCSAYVLWADPTVPGGPSPVCPTKALLGIDCPGCGGLRAVYSLLRGDLPAALHYNAVSLVFLLLTAWSTVAWTAGRLRGRPVDSWLHWRWTPWVAGAVLGAWFVIRNLPFAPFTGLHV